ncbi:MAG: tyrosine-type recombinase/integrase [Gammaproteobacteria bacterium]|nr:tyrosine-type recombinase/integrase [Gammaproteobacteria bacterium]
MKAMSRRLHRLPEAVTPAERPIVAVFVLAERARTPEADRPPEAEATPDNVLPHLDFDLAIRLFDNLPSENTRKAYAGVLRRYRSWLDGRPPTDRLLADYLGAMYDNGLAPPSAVTAVAAVKRAALESAWAGYELAEPPAGHLAAQRLERFHREGVGRGRVQAGPLDWDDADEMCECAEADDDPRGIRDAALVGVISSALLRVAEASALDAGDVSFLANGSAHIDIRRSKTDQHGDGAVCHVVPPAAARLRKWMDTAGVESGPLFRPVPGRRIGETRLSPDAIRAAIKRRAKQAGITRRVSGHSLRVGAAQSLVEEGASLVDLQVAGRWKSSSMPAYYVRNQEASRGAVARLRGGAGQADERSEKKVAESACNQRNGGDNVE